MTGRDEPNPRSDRNIGAKDAQPPLGSRDYANVPPLGSGSYCGSGDGQPIHAVDHATMDIFEKECTRTVDAKELAKVLRCRLYHRGRRTNLPALRHVS